MTTHDAYRKSVTNLIRRYKERFEAQRRLAQKVAGCLEVNEILEKMREEARVLVPPAMEACILILDPEAPQYTGPLQCALYDGPVNCLSCKRSRPAVQNAITKGKAVLAHKSDPIVRPDGSLVEVGPEMAIPVFVGDKIVAVVSVVCEPGTRFSRKDLYLIKDLAESVGQVILRAKRHWEVTQEKIRITRAIGQLAPFVPLSVRQMVENNAEPTSLEKKKRKATMLFLDLEDYTKLSASQPETEVNHMIEHLFSSFVDPIHRSHGHIVETAGDGLMILFKDDDARTNAINAVKTAFDIYDITRELNEKIADGLETIRINTGINSGTALVGSTQFKGALGIRMTYTASGPVTNLAARLGAYAHGGEILIGEETKELIKGIWPVYGRGQARLKRIEQPVKIYSVLKANR